MVSIRKQRTKWTSIQLSSWMPWLLRILARISSRSQTQARKVARELLKRADTIVKHAQTGTTPLELERVCKAWARVPAGIANARARSVAAPIANREPQKSTAEGRKCGQLFSVEHEGGGGGAAN